MNGKTTIELSEAEALEALRQVLKDERKKHWDAQASTKNGIKSDPFRQLERDGRLNAEFVLAEAARIMTKTSSLSAGQRAYISSLMDEAAQRVVSQRAEAKAEMAAKKPAASKARKSTTANKKPAKSDGNAAKSNVNAAKSHKTTTKSNTKK